MVRHLGQAILYSNRFFSTVVGNNPLQYTVKPVLVVTSIKQATCIEQACSQLPKQAATLKCCCIKQAPALASRLRCLLNTGWTVPGKLSSVNHQELNY